MAKKTGLSPPYMYGSIKPTGLSLPYMYGSIKPTGLSLPYIYGSIKRVFGEFSGTWGKYPAASGFVRHSKFHRLYSTVKLITNH
jgi:hypothetical protein